jgi:sugar phosphate permease
MTTGAPRFFPAVYLAFAAGYVMSFFFRNVNAVLSPEMTREFGLAPAALGLLTAVYFVTFTGMQIPAGMLLDRFGPRRVEPVLLLVAAAGARGV